MADDCKKWYIGEKLDSVHFLVGSGSQIPHRHIASVECATSRQAYCDLLLANQTI